MPARRHRAVAGRFPTVRHTAFLLLSGLFTGLSSTVPTAAQDASVERAPPRDPYAGHIADAARRFGIPDAWIRAVMRVESRGDVRAISPKGAIGLMQIMPATWGFARSTWSRRRSLRPTRQHHGGRCVPARDARSLRLAGLSGGLQCRSRPLRGISRDRPPIARRNARLCCCARTDHWRRRSDCPVTVATADPLAWTRAPLFIVHLDGNTGADQRQSDDAPATPSAQETARDPVLPAPRSGGLFVARTDMRGRDE